MPSWYRTGTVTVTNNSKTVTGSGTAWTAAASYSLVGSAFRGPDGLVYEVEAIVNSTTLTLVEPYFSASGGGKSYGLMPTLGLASDLALAVSQLIQRTASTFDAATVLGKSLLSAPAAQDGRAALGIDQAIADQVGAEWVAGAVGFSSSSGALSNANATIAYRKVGRTVFFTATATIISNGSGGGSLRLTVPFAAARNFSFTGRENAATGAQLQGFLGSGQTAIVVYRYDNGYPGGDNRTLVISGVYETSVA